MRKRSGRGGFSSGDVGMEFIQHGQGGGDIVRKLLKCNGDFSKLRTNETLTYEQWIELDRVILEVARQRLVGVRDLMGRGLQYNIGNGLAKTVLAYQDASDVEPAELAMDPVTEGRRDRPQIGTTYLPLPVIFADFSYGLREILESRNSGMPLDTTTASLKARKVAEKAEDILFNGASAYTAGGGTIRGYTDHPNRNTYVLTAAWNDSAATGETILADTVAMKQALIDDKMFGPYKMYISTNYETVLDEDFKTNSDKTIRQRLLEVDKIEDIEVVDTLAADTVIMVQLTPDVVRIVHGLQLPGAAMSSENIPMQIIEWESHGGLMLNFKIIALLVPQIRKDQDNNCGIVHGAP